MKIRGQVHQYLEVEVQETCFLHLTRKSRFLQYVQEIFLHLCSILHLCVGDFPAFCRKISYTCSKQRQQCSNLYQENILQENFQHNASFLRITCKSNYPTKIKPVIIFCGKLSCTSVGSQFPTHAGNQLSTKVQEITLGYLT